MESILSLFIAFAGLSGALYAWRRGMVALCSALSFFSLSGMIQGFSYTVANQCTLPANQIAAVLAYIHLCWQPFFINAAALHFIDKPIARRIDLYVHTLCFTGMTMMFIQGYPFAWAGHCDSGSLMCGEIVCTMRDGWHLAWMLPITKFVSEIPFYFICAILLPFLYGSWRFMVFYLICCPLPAFLLTHSMNEAPGLSAMLSVPFLLVLVSESKLRRKLDVKSWIPARFGKEI